MKEAHRRAAGRAIGLRGVGELSRVEVGRVAVRQCGGPFRREAEEGVTWCWGEGLVGVGRAWSQTFPAVCAG